MQVADFSHAVVDGPPDHRSTWLVQPASECFVLLAQTNHLGLDSCPLGFFGLGTLTFGLGTLTFGLGTLTLGLGTPPFGLGTLTFGLGTLTFGLGTLTWSRQPPPRCGIIEPQVHSRALQVQPQHG